jgi:hypothetical protein
VSEKEKVGGALCHLPIHGIRIFSDDALLFETSLCWACNNYYVESDWAGLTADAKPLRTLLDEVVPIPEAERARMPGGAPKTK